MVMGPVFCLADGEPAEIPRYAIEPADVSYQWGRLQSALERSRSELSLLMQNRTREQTEIIEAHVMMLNDPEFIPRIKKQLEESCEMLNPCCMMPCRRRWACSVLRETPTLPNGR